MRYEHDLLGRVTVRRKTRPSRKPDVWRYAWDAEDRLVSTTTPDGTRWRYLYDPLGRRTAKLRLAQDGESAVERIDFTWDGNTLCEQTNSSSEQPHVVAITWDHEDIRPIAQTERILGSSREEVDSRFFAIVTDPVGAPTELVDESGNVAWHTRSTLWGLTTWSADSTAYTPLRFPGQYADPETGLHYNYFRHYDPENARYLTSDPLGLAPAPNPFTYVANPHAWTDHLGLAPDYIPIYRTPKGAHAQYELAHGPNPANHQPGVDIGGGIISDGKIYFGERAVAAEYAGPTGADFAKGTRYPWRSSTGATSWSRGAAGSKSTEDRSDIPQSSGTRRDGRRGRTCGLESRGGRTWGVYGFIDQVKHPSWWDADVAQPAPGDRLHVCLLDATREPYPRFSALQDDIDIARRLRGEA